MPKFILLISFTLFFIPVFGQNVAINNTGNPPDSSAILDIQSATKGVLFPRMTSSERSAINNPATGLMVFDLDHEKFFCYDSTAWVEVLSGSISTISNKEGDTRVDVEEVEDDDRIRFIMENSEYFMMDGPNLHVLNTGGSVFLGENAGMSDDLSNNFNVYVGQSAGAFNTSGSWNTAIGRIALMGNSSGTRNVAIGAAALQLGSGSENVALGTDAGQQNSGSRNVFVGYETGQTSSGSDNVFLGHNAGYSATGNNKLYIDNTATNSPLVYGEFDNNLLRVNGKFEATSGISGTYSDADGDTKIQLEESTDEDRIRFDMGGAEYFVMNGPRLEVKGSGSSVFLGEFAGASDDLSANNNVFVGRYAGQDNTSGHWNTSVGHSSLLNCTTGNRNVAIGGVALRDNNGIRNVAIGVDAGQKNTGNQSVMIGFESGKNNTGSGNVFLGNNAGEFAVGSNQLYIDNSSTNSPLIYGEFDNNYVEVHGWQQVSGGSDAAPGGGGYLVTGVLSAGNIAIDDNEIMARVNGSTSRLTLNAEGGDIVLGNGTSGNVGIGINVPLAKLHVASGEVRFPSGGPYATHFNYVSDGRNYIRGETLFDHDKVGIGETSPVAKLHVKGSESILPITHIRNTSTGSSSNGLKVELAPHTGPTNYFIEFRDASGNVGEIAGGGGSSVFYSTSSDARLKKNIRPLEGALAILEKLQPAKYQWKSDDSEDIGFLAQELQAVYPYAVSGDSENDPEERPMGVDYGRLTPVLTAAIQELMEEVITLKAEIEILKAEQR